MKIVQFCSETGAFIGKSKNRFTPTTQFTFLVSKKAVKELRNWSSYLKLEQLLENLKIVLPLLHSCFEFSILVPKNNCQIALKLNHFLEIGMYIKY